MVDVARPSRRLWLWCGVALIAISGGIWGASRFSPRSTRSTASFDLRSVGVACPDDPSWVCGSIQVPLDRSSPTEHPITVRFRTLPRRLLAKPSAGTVVVANGGPGDASMPQYAWATAAFGSLLADHELLLVDNRGSGQSSRIDCPEAQQTFSVAAVAQCRSILGTRADDYGTIAAADDMEAVLNRVHASDVDLYGESYGTFFAQVFALRHPERLRRLVLDGALPLDADPWSRDSLSSGLASLRALCRADPSCDSLGDVSLLLARALAELRVGTPPGQVAQGVADMSALIANAGRSGSSYRELPAALHAYLAGDFPPLFRLLSEAHSGGFANSDASATSNSQGLLLADMCTDYPQPFDLRAPLAEQKRQLEASFKAAASAVSPAAFPFRPQEALRDESACLGWPAPTGITPRTLDRHFPNVPTLVLEGGLDTITPPTVARSVANEFRVSRYLEVPYVVHVSAVNDRTGCASNIAAQFLASETIETACLSHIVVPPEVDQFPVSFSQETPIAPTLNRTSAVLSVNERRIVAVTRDAVADIMWRWARLHVPSGTGLRGGRFISGAVDQRGRFHVHLDAIRWTTDTTVSGDIASDPADDSLTGVLEISTPAGAARFALHAASALRSPTVETIDGTVGAHEISVEVDGKLGL
jgi:pimeloyl-ACP methyl ester carboxylesterase